MMRVRDLFAPWWVLFFPGILTVLVVGVNGKSCENRSSFFLEELLVVCHVLVRPWGTCVGEGKT